MTICRPFMAWKISKIDITWSCCMFIYIIHIHIIMELPIIDHLSIQSTCNCPPSSNLSPHTKFISRDFFPFCCCCFHCLLASNENSRIFNLYAERRWPHQRVWTFLWWSRWGQDRWTKLEMKKINNNNNSQNEYLYIR